MRVIETAHPINFNKGVIMKSKLEVKPGDVVHIYCMFGEPQYKDAIGVVKYIDDMNQIHGSWGGLALQFDDDWEIIAVEN